MNSYQASWEDEEDNRAILFQVGYEIIGRTVEIASITPLQVTTRCPETNKPIRTVGVHTETGRALLVRRFLERGQLQVLENTLHIHASVAEVA